MNLAKDLAYRQAVDEWNEAIKKLAPYRILVDGLDVWIKGKRLHNVVMGHTAREVVLEKETVQQLASVNVFFQALVPPISFPPKGPLHPEEALYKDGILYVGRGGTRSLNHKGKRFLDFLSAVNRAGITNPKRVVFVDDRKEHVEGMIKELSSLGILVQGFQILAVLAEE